MLISVVVPTFRLGGLDLIKWSLDQQTLPAADFELVLVDGLFTRRRAAVEKLFGSASYRVKHVPPEADARGEIFPRDAHPRYRNTGIAESRGEICVLWCDYVMAPPMVLSLFAHRFRTIPGKVSICGTHIYGLPPREIVDPRLVPSPCLDDTIALMDSLAPDDRLWTSAFTYDLETVFGLIQTSAFAYPLDKQDPKLRLLSGTTIPNIALHMKNEAVRRADLREVCGLDETYNDTKCADDLDLGMRLGNAGVTFVLDKSIDVLIPDPHVFTPELRRTRTHLEALADWELRRRPILASGAIHPEKSLFLSEKF